MNDKGHYKDIKDSVLARLETEDIRPTSRWYWLSQEYGLWITWFASVSLGSAALAVISFSSVYIGYSFYEATHSNFLTFLMDALPYLWFLAFLVMILAAYFNIRYTRRGYRYPLLLVVGSSFGFSILGGMFLHYLGAGYYLDRFFDRHISVYQSHADFELLSWQNPDKGRLVGMVTPQGPFLDTRKKEWDLVTTELYEKDQEMLRSGDRVRILFATSSEVLPDTIVVCGVFPWRMDNVPVLAKWRDDRMSFLESIQERRGQWMKVVEGMMPEEKRVSDPEIPKTPPVSGGVHSIDSPCAKLPLFRVSGVDVQW